MTCFSTCRLTFVPGPRRLSPSSPAPAVAATPAYAPCRVTPPGLRPSVSTRAAFAVEQPAHLPEFLLRVPHVQRQDRAAEQPSQPLLQAGLAVDDDLHRLAVPAGIRDASPAPAPTPAPTAANRTSRRPSCGSAVQPAGLAPPQGVHHHQGVAAAVLLFPLLPLRLPAPPLPPGPAPMPLTPAARFVTDPRSTPPRQFLRCGRGGRLAVDLDDQHLAVVLGKGLREVDVGRPRQAQTHSSIAEAVGGPQEHRPQAAGDLETHPVASRQNQP